MTLPVGRATNGLVVELVVVREVDDEGVDVAVLDEALVLGGAPLSMVLDDAPTGSSSSLAAAKAIAAISTATKTHASAILFRIRFMSSRHCRDTARVGTSNRFGGRTRAVLLVRQEFLDGAHHRPNRRVVVRAT